MTRSRIGPLALESPLGERGSNVFRAVHMQQRTQVVVRVFSIPMGMTPESKQEFADQLESLKALRHPGIVRCYGGGFDAKDAYLVYELMQGESLATSLKRRERLPWESVLDYGLQICEALQYAHEAGWIHRRIRLDKILVSEDANKVKLSDFRRGPGQPSPLTLGQLAYSAPETLGGQQIFNAAADLYSVGAVMYHAITGQPPFHGETPIVVKQAIVASSVAPVASIVFDCPVWLSAIVEQLLNKDPLRRPYSAAATAMALREAQRRATDGIGVAEHAVSGFSALQLNTNRAEAEVALGRKKKKRRGHDEEAYDRPGLFERPIVLIGLLAAAICLIAFLVWPAGEKTLLSRAQRLMENEDLSSHNEAQDKYLVQLIERFPNSESAIWAEDQMLLIEMENAEARMQSNVRRRRDPSTEGERKYLEAMDTRKFGDPATALEKFEGIVNLLKSEEKERPFVNLAKRQIREIKSQPIGGTNEVRRFLLEKLDQAEKMLERGDAIGAKQTWEAIVNLYIGNKDFLPIVERAQARLGKSKG